MSVWNDREFVASIAIAGVAFILLLLLMVAICLLIFYHRKVNQLSKYGLGKFWHYFSYTHTIASTPFGPCNVAMLFCMVKKDRKARQC